MTWFKNTAVTETYRFHFGLEDNPAQKHSIILHKICTGLHSALLRSKDWSPPTPPLKKGHQDEAERRDQSYTSKSMTLSPFSYMRVAPMMSVTFHDFQERKMKSCAGF